MGEAGDQAALAMRPGAVMTGTRWRVSFSMPLRNGRSSPEQNEMATPVAPARAVLADAADLAAWPAPERTGDLAALDEAAAIDAVACAITAHRCLHGPADSWARIGTADSGRVLIPAGPDLIARAVVNIARLADEGSIAMPREVAGGAVGPAHSW